MQMHQMTDDIKITTKIYKFTNSNYFVVCNLTSWCELNDTCDMCIGPVTQTFKWLASLLNLFSSSDHTVVLLNQQQDCLWD